MVKRTSKFASAAAMRSQLERSDQFISWAVHTEWVAMNFLSGAGVP